MHGYGFNTNTSFTFQAVKNFSAHPTYLRFGLVVFQNFLFSSNPSLNFLKLHLNSGKISWLGTSGLLVNFLRHSLGCYNKSILDEEI